MTDPTTPEDISEHDTFADILSLQAENARVISELSAAQRQNAQAIERLAETVEGLRTAQTRTSQDVSTLKGWGLENLCERHPELVADALGLRGAELIPTTEIIDIAKSAHEHDIITRDQRASVTSADVYFYGRLEPDDTPACLLVQVSFLINVRDVRRAFDQAGILKEIILQYQPRNLNGDVIAVVSGTEINQDASSLADELDVKYVQIQNGNQLTNPPE